MISFFNSRIEPQNLISRGVKGCLLCVRATNYVLTRSLDLLGQLMASMGRNFSRVGSISGAESESGQTQNVMKYEKFDCLVTIKFLMFVEL